jgi:hypothetical protein
VRDAGGPLDAVDDIGMLAARTNARTVVTGILMNLVLLFGNL